MLTSQTQISNRFYKTSVDLRSQERWSRSWVPQALERQVYLIFLERGLMSAKDVKFKSRFKSTMFRSFLVTLESWAHSWCKTIYLLKQWLLSNHSVLQLSWGQISMLSKSEKKRKLWWIGCNLMLVKTQRLADLFSNRSREVRGRERASDMSWSLIPTCSCSMSQPVVSTLQQRFASSRCWRRRHKQAWRSWLQSINPAEKYSINLIDSSFCMTDTLSTKVHWMSWDSTSKVLAATSANSKTPQITSSSWPRRQSYAILSFPTKNWSSTTKKQLSQNCFKKWNNLTKISAASTKTLTSLTKTGSRRLGPSLKLFLSEIGSIWSETLDLWTASCSTVHSQLYSVWPSTSILETTQK